MFRLCSGDRAVVDRARRGWIVVKVKTLGRMARHHADGAAQSCPWKVHIVTVGMRPDIKAPDRTILGGVGQVRAALFIRRFTPGDIVVRDAKTDVDRSRKLRCCHCQKLRPSQSLGKGELPLQSIIFSGIAAGASSQKEVKVTGARDWPLAWKAIA